MTKLFDLLNNDSIKSITQKSIEIGNVYRIPSIKVMGSLQNLEIRVETSFLLFLDLMKKVTFTVE